MTTRPLFAEDDGLEQPRVLLVDDDEVNLLLTSIALRERGFSITEASSGEQALQVLTEWLPDIVVLDAIMPGRCAAPPAPAISTSRPRSAAELAYSNSKSGVLWADTTFVS